jgi:hypothetical protein
MNGVSIGHENLVAITAFSSYFIFNPEIIEPSRNATWGEEDFLLAEFFKNESKVCG